MRSSADIDKYSSMISVKTVCRPDVEDTVVLHLLVAGAELKGAHRLSLRQLRHLHNRVLGNRSILDLQALEPKHDVKL